MSRPVSIGPVATHWKIVQDPGETTLRTNQHDHVTEKCHTIPCGWKGRNNIMGDLGEHMQPHHGIMNLCTCHMPLSLNSSTKSRLPVFQLKHCARGRRRTFRLCPTASRSRRIRSSPRTVCARRTMAPLQKNGRKCMSKRFSGCILDL